MRRICRLTSGRVWKHTLALAVMCMSDAPPQPDSLGAAFGEFHPHPQPHPATRIENELALAPLLSVLVSDLQALEKKWSRRFRVCISSDSSVVVEATTGITHNWTPVAALDAANLPLDLAQRVEDALAASAVAEPALTLVDLRERAEDIAVAQKFLAERFPRLRLCVDHSKGTDLQGTVTHTVTVSLRVNGSLDELSAEEKTIKNSFFGESVGVSFAHTARRALLEAFNASGIPSPSTRRNAERDQGVNELGIFLDIIQSATGDRVDIVPSLDDKGQVRVLVGLRGGRPINVLDGRREDALSIVLACVEKASENVNSIATEAARRRIADHPVVLALPSKGLRPKEVLRRLLFHTYGLSEDRVHIVTSHGGGGTFVTTVDVELRWGDCVNTSASSTAVVSTLAEASGVNKKASEALACMMAVQRCFPRIFEDQLSYHAEVKEIMNSSKATGKGSICPHISRGLLSQLRWAAHCQGKQVLLDVVQLLPNSENEALGIRTTRTLWATQLFLVDGNDTREFICLALDPKKSASEQKAIAAALWKCFKDECMEGVKYAIDHGLINKDGDFEPCEGISSSIPPPKSDHEVAAESDAFIAKLQLLPSQRIPVPYRQSLLSIFRRGAQLYVDLLNERSGDAGSCLLQLVEYTEKEVESGLFKAQLLLRKDVGRDTAAGGGEATTTPLGEAFNSTTAIGALFGTMKALFDAEGVIATAAEKDSQTKEIFSETCRRVAELTPFPTQLPAPTPLETIAHSVMIKYGLSLELRISGGGKMVHVQLFGHTPTSLGGDASLKPQQNFLGHGRGGSLLKAVVSCCRNVFSTHIRCGDDALQTAGLEVITSGSVDVLFHGASLLASRLEDVKKELTENGAVSTAASVCVKIDIRSSLSVSEVAYEAHLSVLDGMRVVELERSPPAAGLITSLQHLTESVTQEMGGHPVNLEGLLRRFSGPLLCNTLEQVLQELYGLSLAVETQLKDRNWCCQLGVHLSNDLYYCIGGAASTRKKEAMEMAAARAMDHCFGHVAQTVKLVATGEATTTPDTTAAEAAHMEKLSGFVYRKLGDTCELHS